MSNKNNINITTEHKFDKKTMLGIICLIVVISGIFGFLYEFIFYYFNSGMTQFYYRGSNFLPWINIYAIGSLMICFLTYKDRQYIWKVFLKSTILCGLLEYISGYLMYTLFNFRCWDYNSEILNFGNIGGFICLRSVLFFGISSLFLVYIIVPFIHYLAGKMNKNLFVTISIILFSIIIMDELYNLVFARILSLPRASDIYKSMGIKYMHFKS